MAQQSLVSSMSALGHKRTFCYAGVMSALPPIADISQLGASFSFLASIS